MFRSCARALFFAGALVLGASGAALGQVSTSSAAEPAATVTATTTVTATATVAEASHWYDGFVPVPVVFYTPETRLGVGAMLIYTFDGPENEGHRRSNLLFRAFYTLEKQISVFVEPNLWAFGDFFGLTGWYEGRLYPFKFYGVGNGPNLDVADDYTEKMFEAVPQATFRLSGNLRAGANLHILAGTATEYPADGLLVQSGVTGLDGQVVLGLGPTISWDTRNSNFWPTSGSLINLDLTLFNGAWGSDYDFMRVTADVRGYVSPWLDHVLSMQGYMSLTDGNVPFTLLANLGGTRRHRGWYYGSLRDQHAFLLQAEYRAPIWWRFGAVAFASLGQVVPDLEKVDLGELTSSVGAGLRFRLNDEGVNIRVDFAYGGQFELYFQVGEAF